MKNIYKISLIVAVQFLNQTLFGQTISLTSGTSPVSGSICPGRSTYSVTIPAGCTPFWTATNGSISGPSNQSSLSVDWVDTPNATASLSVTFSNCTTPGDNSKTASWSALILSVKDQAWGSYGNNISLDFCNTQSVAVTVPRMYVQGTGGIAQPPQQEVIYTWQVPAGWREANSNSGGQVSTSSNAIILNRIGCALPGIVSVRGNIINRCGSAGQSSVASISLNGFSPALTVGPQAGFTGITACNNTPVNFISTLNGSVGCISSYRWIFPSGWRWRNPANNQLLSSPVTNNLSSVSLIPSGTSADQGPIRAEVNFSCGTTISSGSYTIPYIAPLISGPDFICTTGNYSVQNISGITPTWTSSDPSILTFGRSGFASRPGSNSGYVTITATLPCAATVPPKTIFVGDPSITYSPPGTNPCFNNPYYSAPNVPGLSYYWSVDNPNVWFTTSSNSNSTAVISYNPEYFTITLSISNGTCTTTSSQFSYTAGYYCQCFFDPACNGGFSRFAASPNPASNQVDVSFDDKEYEKELKRFGAVEYNLALLDEQGNIVAKVKTSDKTYKWDTSKIPNGTYYLKANYKSFGETKRILIKH